MDSAHYFDSSAILQMLFQQEHAIEVLKCWEQSQARISSLLSYFECVNVAQRYSHKFPESSRLNLEGEAIKWLERTMASLALHEINTTVLSRLKKERQLCNCRTLDAIHLATVLLMLDAGVQVYLVSYDDRMRRTAGELGIKIYQPPSEE